MHDAHDMLRIGDGTNGLGRGLACMDRIGSKKRQLPSSESGASAPGSASIIHAVDDDEPFWGAVSRLLLAAGHQIQLRATAGAFLLDRLTDTPRCLLLDVQVPGLRRRPERRA